MGFYSSEFFSRACHACPPGKYSDHVGSSICKSCSPGTFQSEDATMCIDCVPGRYALANSTFCSNLFFDIDSSIPEIRLISTEESIFLSSVNVIGSIIRRNFSSFDKDEYFSIGNEYVFTAVRFQNFLYLGNFGDPSIVSMISYDSLNVLKQMELPGAFLSTVASKDGFAFFGTFTQPGMIFKVDLANLKLVANLTLSFGEDFLSASVISGPNAYFCTFTNPSKIIKVSINNLQKIDHLNLKEDQSFLNTALADENNAYFGKENEEGSVAKIDLENFIQDQMESEVILRIR